MLAKMINCDCFFHARQSYFLVCLSVIYNYVLLLYTEFVNCMNYLFPVHLLGVQSRLWLGSLATVAIEIKDIHHRHQLHPPISEQQTQRCTPFSFLWINSEQLQPLIKVNDHIPLILLRGDFRFLILVWIQYIWHTWESRDVFCMQMLKQVFLYSYLILFLFSFCCISTLKLFYSGIQYFLIT